MKNVNAPVEELDTETVDSDLHELFMSELADILSAEQQLTKSLPKMAKAATSEDLKAAFESHLAETQNQITRIEQVFTALDESVKRKTCLAMKGLVEEAEELIKELKGSTALDSALIAAAQKVEHYEIASYGTVRAWAARLDHGVAAELLSVTLDEEKAADQKLTEITESFTSEIED